MTTNWQRPRDEHGRFAKPVDLNGATYAGRHHEFELGPQMGLCRACGGGWADWQHHRNAKDPEVCLDYSTHAGGHHWCDRDLDHGGPHRNHDWEWLRDLNGGFKAWCHTVAKPLQAWPAGAAPGLYRFHAVGPDGPLGPGSKISPAGWIEPVEERTRLLAALPFVIALLGLGFSIAALIVGVQR